jgi:hypothetical protein
MNNGLHKSQSNINGLKNPDKLSRKGNMFKAILFLATAATILACGATYQGPTTVGSGHISMPPSTDTNELPPEVMVSPTPITIVEDVQIEPTVMEPEVIEPTLEMIPAVVVEVVPNLDVSTQAPTEIPQVEKDPNDFLLSCVKIVPDPNQADPYGNGIDMANQIINELKPILPQIVPDANQNIIDNLHAVGNESGNGLVHSVGGEISIGSRIILGQEQGMAFTTAMALHEALHPLIDENNIYEEFAIEMLVANQFDGTTPVDPDTGVEFVNSCLSSSYAFITYTGEYTTAAQVRKELLATNETATDNEYITDEQIANAIWGNQDAHFTTTMINLYGVPSFWDLLQNPESSDRSGNGSIRNIYPERLTIVADSIPVYFGQPILIP